VKDKRCKTPFCPIQISNKQYKGYCLRCFIFTYPDRPVARNYKTKETAVLAFVRRFVPNVDITADRIVFGGCSERRPDILIDLGFLIIIIEIDENQHEDYEEICENRRAMEISRDLQHRPIVFIRFNPDEYIGVDGKKVTSCWGVDGNGICVVKKSKTKEWNLRLEKLRETIAYWIHNNENEHKMVETVQLFYDYFGV
jgi:hypothetical protein